MWVSSLFGTWLSPAIGVALLICIGQVHATAQQGELLEIESKQFAMCSTPLAPYLDGLPSPPKALQGSVRNTSLWRGYVGSWTIRHDSLILTKIEVPEAVMRSGRDGGYETKWRAVPLDSIVPNRKPPILANWYSGTLRIPDGDLVQYVHMGFASSFEREIFIDVRQGVVLDKRVVDYGAPDNFRSLEDYLRCPNIDSVIDTGTWVDMRLVWSSSYLDTPNLDSSFKTRGLIVNRDDSAVLWLPSTTMTQEEFLHFEPAVLDTPLSDLTPVEVTIRNDSLKHIRLLRENESIHSLKYPRQHKQSRK